MKNNKIMKGKYDSKGFSGINPKALKDAEKAGDAPYCGSCFGAEREVGHCCNTCEDVREAYLKKGWGFNALGVEQVSFPLLIQLEYEINIACSVSVRDSPRT